MEYRERLYQEITDRRKDSRLKATAAAEKQLQGAPVTAGAPVTGKRV